ncbi:MAG: hypothetical protein HVN34_05435 [Methanobacteriaceae archaeon]|jgi:hypothetical protein|nr:hypothetical protein [Methanobacteriaceae archaeon]OPY20125.1 MAG: hypothetical protein A4E26_02021 [Methanobacterium sp. PtaU1.Bin097]
MDDSNNNSKSLLKKAYNCKSTEFESMLEKIDDELRKNKDDQDALTAKLVLTSKMAVKRIDSK